MKPAISVITATYYRPELLERCIISVQAQSFTNYEHIIVSDHCPHAAAVVKKYAKDKRIKFIEVPTPHKESQGAIAKNIGILASKAEYICYCDDDNFYLPNHLEVLYNSIGDADICYSLGWHIMVSNEAEIVLHKDWIKYLPNVTDEYLTKLQVNNNNLFDSVSHQYAIINCDMLNCMHTKQLIIDVGMWKPVCNEVSVEDRYLMNLFEEKGVKTNYINNSITCVYFARKYRD